MTGDNIPAKENKSDRSRNAELQVGYNQGEYPNHPQKIMFPTKQIPFCSVIARKIFSLRILKVMH